MSIFHWLTGNKDHHIIIKEGRGSRFWWEIVRRDEEFGGPPIVVYKDVANSPTPGFAKKEEAEQNARKFLDGIGADFLEVQEETECSAS